MEFEPINITVKQGTEAAKVFEAAKNPTIVQPF
jgi:hypothetical protein